MKFWSDIKTFKVELLLFRILGFSKNEYKTYLVAAESKSRSRNIWYINNFFAPLAIIISPYILTLLHHGFGTVNYSKSFIDILIGGSLTLIGVNVIRTSSTMLTEKIDDSKVPKESIGAFKSLQNEIGHIRDKLNMYSWGLTIVGAMLYFIQVGQFVNSSNNYIYIVLSFVVFVTGSSIICGRFISLMKSNFFEDQNVMQILFNSLTNQGADYKSLEEKINNLGL